MSHRFDSDEVRLFRRYATENLSSQELEESKKQAKPFGDKRRHQELSESQKQNKDKALERILLENRPDFAPAEKEPAAENVKKAIYPAKLCS